uniref:F5/8 type C domain-containing protein n=1 Tax=Vespula pensylvanica TaxID=30213 RepID=A0A834U464_VESPE|nr:hypothetical protein H0235_012165 [Vespula pensylvanica]
MILPAPMMLINAACFLYRLKTESLGGAWCPKNQITKEAKEWLEIDLHTVHLITATATQGRFGNGQGVEYSEAYLLEYWRPRLGKWVRYRDIKGQEVSLPYHANEGSVKHKTVPRDCTFRHTLEIAEDINKAL